MNPFCTQHNFLLRLLFSVFVLCAFCINKLDAQVHDIDSLRTMLHLERIDSNKVKLFCLLSKRMSDNYPDSAIHYATLGMNLANKIKDRKGEAKSMTLLANTLSNIGQYTQSLKYYLKRLEIDEATKNLPGMAETFMNIGIFYSAQKDFSTALPYFRKSDSIIQKESIDDSKWFIATNLGDVFDKLDKLDSGQVYFLKSLALATLSGKKDWIGTSVLGLGNIAKKQKKHALAIAYYQQAISNLDTLYYADFICEATLGLAHVYHNLGRNDSSLHFVHQSLDFAIRDKFISQEFDATLFLKNYYDEHKNFDSAYFYLKKADQLQDSLESAEKVKTINKLTFDEQVRQTELKEKEHQEQLERSQQLQLIIIGIFISIIFMLSVLLTQVKVNLKLIRFVGVISLLFLFEYLTLLLHPIVLTLTHHNPIFEILIFVCIAALIIPLHHKLEHWVVEYLVKRAQMKRNELPIDTSTIKSSISINEHRELPKPSNTSNSNTKPKLHKHNKQKK